ncbi:MAG TPA: response regulator [Nitrososphaeraceae archaeon]|nr:response regulator [Nitrososphaeraceae archaeon]
MSIGKLVSIVDDEEDITTLFHDALKRIDGITLFTFTDPILALEHFQKNHEAYVLVISDFRMPGLNGTELLRKMKDTNKHIRTILMTAFEMEDSILGDYAKREIINSFFQKPVRLTDLIDVVYSELHTHEIQKTIPTQR